MEQKRDARSLARSNTFHTVTEKRFGEYHEDNKSVTLRNSGATCGGGSEVLVICSIKKQLARSVQEITRESETNMSPSKS